MHFANQQEYFRYLRSKPVEPERYEEPKEEPEKTEEEPEKRLRRRKKA